MAVEAGTDALGLNFHPPSRRFVSIEKAREIVRALPEGFPTYAVVVDLSRAKIEEILRETGVSGVQFHGAEGPAQVEGWDVPVIRAVPANSQAAVLAELDRSESRDSGARLLVDSAAGGGSGVLVDPDLLEGCDLSAAVLAGGLTPGNVAAIVRRFRPFGVDCAGGVESEPGIKDPHLTREFIGNAKSVDFSTAR